MKKILPFLFLVLFISCKKEKENAPLVLNFQKILEKYLICDSIKVKSGGVTTVQVIGKGNGEDLRFHSDASYTIYSNPQQIRSFQLTPPDKLYYYNDVLDPNTYYLVTSLTETKLVLQKNDAIASTVYTRYFSVE